jgi:Sensors of blue-light using FAD
MNSAQSKLSDARAYLRRVWRGSNGPADRANEFAKTEAAEFEMRATGFEGVLSRAGATHFAAADCSKLGVDSDLLEEFLNTPPRARLEREREHQMALGQPLYAVVYVSKAANTLSPHDQVRELKLSSTLRNYRTGIKSALVMQDGMFCQWLQGDVAEVEQVVARIKRDERHDGFMTLYRGVAPASLLDPWSMGLRSLYMGQGDAFERAQRLRFQAQDQPYTSPYDAWMAFTGVTNLRRTVDGRAAPIKEAELGEPITLVGSSSRIGTDMLVDAAKGERTALGVTRWGSVLDRDCDLQTVGGLMQVGQQTTYVASVSAKALRVGAVREAVQHRGRWVLSLADDDPARAHQLLEDLEAHTPEGHAPKSVAVVAPKWSHATREHVRHLLQMRAWPGEVHALDLRKHGSWRAMGELVAA